MKKFAGTFRYSQWDPLLLISQIVAMQCVLYVSLGVLTAMFQDVSKSTRTLDHIFKYQAIHVRDFEGQIMVTGFVLNSVIGSIALSILVQRTKLCLDFSFTYHFIHLIFCWLYSSHFPSSYSWWILNICCGAVTCLLGEFLCLRSELKEIPLAVGKVDV